MTETQIKSVALFFYFTLLDEDLAEKAGHETIEICRKKFKKDNLSEGEQLAILIYQMHLKYGHLRSTHVLNRASLSKRTHYLTPAGISFGAWRQFHKEASPEDLVSVVLSQILGFEDGAIAIGLGVTVGSVRYRVGRGLRQLGHLITMGESIV